MQPGFIHTFLVCLAVLPGPVLAASAEAEERANYAFAAYTGNGLYTATDASLYVLNVPFSFSLDRTDIEDVRVRLTTSTGFFDYELASLEGLEFPDSVGTLTVIPGIEKTFHMSERWELIPHADLGYARNFSTDESAIVYSVGVDSRFYTEAARDDHLWVNEAIFAGYRTRTSGEVDGYAKLLMGFDYKTEKDLQVLGAQVTPTVYGKISWHHNGLEALEALREESTNELNYEVGFSLYAHEPLDLSLFKISRVGIGLHYNEFGTVFRFFVGSPF